MVSVRINGQQSEVPVHAGLKVGDLVELIKSVIDPEHMITSFRIDGSDLSDQDWNSTLGAFGTSIVEFETGDPTQYVLNKIAVAPEVIQACAMAFREARVSFKQLGTMNLGQEYNVILKKANEQFSEAAKTLQAFFEWYDANTKLINAEDRAQFSVDSFMLKIAEVGSRMNQQQMYQSWWALTETVQRELEPVLNELETKLRSFTVSAPMVAQS